MKFWKIQASGNDFVAVLSEDAPSKSLRSDFAKKICERKTSIGADGFLVLEKLSDNELSWDFYNSDGSTAEMCGNASRAVAHLFLKEMAGSLPVSLMTGGGKTLLSGGEGSYSVRMPLMDDLGSEDEGYLWNTGVPHFVFEMVFSKDHKKAKDFCKSKRFPKALDEKGANVSLWYEAPDGFHAISFERGVEDFTLACGTGAAACGLDIFRKKNLEEKSVDLKLPGGRVQIKQDQSAVYLLGDASVVYEGRYNNGL